MFGNSSEKRFEEIHSEGVASGNKIIVDRETGVHYLYSWNGYSGGITPLLDENGKPIVKKI
jgi:hypothetical protein